MYSPIPGVWFPISSSDGVPSSKPPFKPGLLARFISWLKRYRAEGHF